MFFDITSLMKADFSLNQRHDVCTLWPQLSIIVIYGPLMFLSKKFSNLYKDRIKDIMSKSFKGKKKVQLTSLYLYSTSVSCQFLSNCLEIISRQIIFILLSQKCIINKPWLGVGSCKNKIPWIDIIIKFNLLPLLTLMKNVKVIKILISLLCTCF